MSNSGDKTCGKTRKNSNEQDNNSKGPIIAHPDSERCQAPTISENRYFWRYLLPATILMLACCAIPRFNWRFFCDNYATYPSDIWYIYDNYGWFLKNRAFFQMEYPASMFVLFKVLMRTATLLPGVEPGKFGGTICNYTNWMIVNTAFLGSCAIATVWFSHKLNCRYLHCRPSAVLWGLVLTPSFLFFTIYNYDLVPILCCTAGLWMYLEDDYLGACALIGLGCSFKIYPGVMFPLFWLTLARERRFKALLAFLVPIIILNVPYALYDWELFIHPYVWQAQFDNTEQVGRLVYHLTLFIGKGPALLLMSALMGIFIYQGWRRRPTNCANDALWLVRCSLVLIASFEMLKNVYSPQYLLWLSPFLAFSGGYPFYGIYSLMELCSGLEVSCLYFWREQMPSFLVFCRIFRDIVIMVVWGLTMRHLLSMPGKTALDEDRE